MNHDDDLTSTLGRELGERAGTMEGSTLHLADVKGRARSIRRRRTATAVVGAVAAVGLIVPTAALATHSNGEPEPGPAHSPSPTATTTDDGAQPAPGVLDLSHLSTGAAPRMDYVQDGSLHLTDGTIVDVSTRHDPRQLVELADGARVWSTADEKGRSYIEIQDTDGTVHDPIPSTGGLSVNRQHSIAAWLTTSGQVTIWEGWASEPRPLGDPVPGSDLRVGPITGDGGAAPGQPGPSCQQSSCSVIVNVHDGAGQPWEVDASGSQKLLDGGYLHLNDISEGGLSVGLTKVTDSSTCSALQGGGEFQGFSTCQNQLTSFSPDGRLILALPSYFDGLGPGGVAMYDLKGTKLFERSSTEQAQSYFTEATWEDQTHVLAPAYQDGKWAVVRIASDGSMQYAVAPEPGPFEASPFILPTGGGLPGA
jgi:hypothetical protein